MALVLVATVAMILERGEGNDQDVTSVHELGSMFEDHSDSVIEDEGNGKELDAGKFAGNTFVPKGAEKEFLSKSPFNSSVYADNQVEEHVLKIKQHAQREGYETVVRYMDQLAKHPMDGKSDTLGKAAEGDPRIQDQHARIHGMEQAVEEYRTHALHSKQMISLLEDDARGVELSTPDMPNKLQKQEASDQIKQIHNAIDHEKKASAAWMKKLNAGQTRLHQLYETLQQLRSDYIKEDAKHRAIYLANLAQDRVDFAQWRATHSGKDYDAFQAWKQQNMIKTTQDQHEAKMEVIRSHIENHLEKQMRSEFTNVKSEVNAAADPTTAAGIAAKIEILSHTKSYDEEGRADQAKTNIAKRTRLLNDKFNKDSEHATAVQTEALNYRNLKFHGKTQPMETEQQKQERLDGLIANGVLKGDPAIQAERGLNKDKLLQPVQFEHSTEAGYMFDQAKKKDDPWYEIKQQHKLMELTDEVDHAKHELNEWNKNRQNYTDTMVAKTVKDEENSDLTNNIKMSLMEAKVKYHALAQIKHLNQKLVDLQGFTNAAERNAEVKAKKEINEINARVKAAKKAVTLKQKVVDVAKAKLVAMSVAEKDDFDVVPVAEP